jgi:hypothetical protein
VNEATTTMPLEAAGATPKRVRRRRTALRTLALFTLIVLAVAIVGRLILPYSVRWYVNRVIDQSPLYDGKIDDVDIHLYRGAYSIRGVRIIKTAGNVPVPLFSAKKVDLAIEWSALWAGKMVGSVQMIEPELNFVDGGNDGGRQGGDGSGQTGAGGPWLGILRDLFPFKINSVNVVDGSVHFRTYQKDVPVDVYLSQLQASVENLTNIHDETTPLVTTVEATALAMDQAKFEYQMKLDPFSYKPAFNMTTRLLNLDITKINELTHAYGNFDFERGWFDLVIELDAKEGSLNGYVKPLFRNIRVFDLKHDLEEDNALQAFYEAVVDGAQNLLKNWNRDQFGTLIPFTGNVDSPRTDVLATIGNVLRNAFIRAYLPRLDRGGYRDSGGLEFGPAADVDSLPEPFSATTTRD